MTPFRRKNSSDLKDGRWFLSEPYILANIIFAGVILLIFAYSGIFSPEKNNYPVACIHEKLTGEPCVSCGLSHSFSLIVRGRIKDALIWNVYGLRIFLFFALQLAMRVVFSIIWINNREIRRELVIYDIAGSIIIFFVSFWPFIDSIFSQIFL